MDPQLSPYGEGTESTSPEISIQQDLGEESRDVLYVDKEEKETLTSLQMQRNLTQEVVTPFFSNYEQVDFSSFHPLLFTHYIDPIEPTSSSSKILTKIARTQYQFILREVEFERHMKRLRAYWRKAKENFNHLLVSIQQAKQASK